MFKITTNSDLMEKLSHLENKIDVTMTKIDSRSIEGCCDCKLKETLVYEELRDYINNEFQKFYNSEDISNDNALLKQCNIEIIKRLDSIVSRIYFCNKFDTRPDQLLNNIKQSLDSLNSKLDGIIFENEIIKHQLCLENDIRETIQQVNNINFTVNDTVQKIDEYISL